MRTLIIIPARGGSKGIPRKNLRPLAGKPLIYYSINEALKVKGDVSVYVSTDDDEIQMFSKRFGANVVMRPSELATDAVTLDPVICRAVVDIESEQGRSFDNVVTVQPTSPLIKAEDIERAIEKFRLGKSDTVVSVVDDRHLSWKMVEGRLQPEYEERVNRQSLPARFKENGAVVVCGRKQIDQGSRVGSVVDVVEMPQDRSFDIDTPADFYLCDLLLKSKKVLFVVVGRKELGLGHAYRAVMLAHELIQCEIEFLCCEEDDLAAAYIEQHNYQVTVCDSRSVISNIAEIGPHLVINDVLDTTIDYISKIKELGCKVVNFEDMGEGGEKADLVVNALYPHQIPSSKILTGERYFCLRDEFIHVEKKVFDGTKILITFGGVDEGELSYRVLKLLVHSLPKEGIWFDVVVGPGYQGMEKLADYVDSISEEVKVSLTSSTSRISDHMNGSIFAVTSGGRTVLELASLSVPTLVICQNKREMTHTFASSKNGVMNLGVRENVSDADIISSALRLLKDAELRAQMRDKMDRLDLSKGKARVINYLRNVLESGFEKAHKNR